MWQSMFSQPSPLRSIFRLLWALPLAAILTPFPPALAETESPVLISLQFPPGSGSAPKRTAGAGVRGNCAPGLTAIIPDSAVSMTVNEKTTFFVYIPQTDALLGKFSLNLSEDGSRNYTEDVLLSGKPGMVSFTLPQEIALAMNDTYDWKFTLYCDLPGATAGLGGGEQRISSVSGQVQRVDLSATVEAELAKATTPLAKAEVYAKAGIWHEAMAILSDLRDSQPQQWQELLTSVGLNALAQAPLVDQP